MHLKEKLHDWIEELPEIFRDEMNGYDFDLDFSGTKNDFEDLKKAFKNAFKKAGISDPQVHFFHRNELSGREEKLDKIEELMSSLIKKHWKGIIGFLVIAIILPLAFWLFRIIYEMKGAIYDVSWLGFFGSYLGGVL